MVLRFFYQKKIKINSKKLYKDILDEIPDDLSLIKRFDDFKNLDDVINLAINNEDEEDIDLQQKKKKEQKLSIMDELNNLIEENNNNMSNNEIDELDIYLHNLFTKQELDDFKDDPLKCWTGSQAKLQMDKLNGLAAFIHAMQPSEAPSECLFSISNIIVNEKRTSLKNKKVSLLSFLVSRWKLQQK